MVIGSCEVNQLYSMLPLQSSSPGDYEEYEDQRRLVTVKSIKMAMILMMMDVMTMMIFTKGRVSKACSGRKMAGGAKGPRRAKASPEK